MPYLEEINIGQEITPRKTSPTAVQLFRYSALTWNAHLIHYNKEYAQSEGYPDILVQAHLHGAFLASALTDWMGPDGRLLSYGWKNYKFAVPGDELTCKARVVDINEENNIITCEIYEENQDGEICARGKATLRLPSKG